MGPSILFNIPIRAARCTTEHFMRNASMKCSVSARPPAARPPPARPPPAARGAGRGGAWGGGKKLKKTSIFKPCGSTTKN